MKIDELAEAVDADAVALYRVMRALAALDIFRENVQREFELTPMAQFLCSDHEEGLRYIAMLNSGPLAWQPQGALLDCVKTGKPAFDEIFKANLYDYLGQHHDAASLFGKAMTNLTNVDLQGIVDHLDCHGIETLVDIGAGEGGLLAGILEKYPNMQGILADRVDVVETAEKILQQRGLSDRCQCTPIDFFQSVPAGGDAYIMRKVLHNWDDEKVVIILKNCRAQMADQTKLFVVEAVLPTDNSGARPKLRDIEMMIYLDGKQRTEEDYRRLFDAAGLSLTDVIITGAPSSIIQGVPV